VEPELYRELGEALDETITPREALALCEAMKALGVKKFRLPSGLSVVFENPSGATIGDADMKSFIPDYMKVHDDGFL
tara:strand:+ start:263 stop:493 length:231 start_codon:yes stop_codon:yes gene_type:complete